MQPGQKEERSPEKGRAEEGGKKEGEQQIKRCRKLTATADQTKTQISFKKITQKDRGIEMI